MRLNEMLNRWSHWGVNSRDKREWRCLVKERCGEMRGIDFRVHLGIIVFRKIKAQDPDNRVGSVKHLVDAINRCGWLVDDSDEWLDLAVAEKVDGVGGLTTVYWTPLR